MKTVQMENYTMQITRNGDYKLYNREKRCRKIKEERQATVSAIYGGIISVAFPVALFALWLAIGYQKDK